MQEASESGRKSKVLNITDSWLKSKTVTEGREVWHDSSTKGFGVRISFTGKKVWQLLYRMAGDPTKRRVDLGEYPAIGVKEARAKARDMLTQVDQGIDPAGKVKRAKEAPTFAKLAEEYLERHAKPNKRSWRDDELTINKHLLPEWRHRKAEAIKRRDVIALLDTIIDQGHPIAANRTLALVRKMYRWANSRDLVEANPCFGISAPAPERQRDRVLTEDEIRKVWAAFTALAFTPEGKASPQGAMLGTMFKLRFLTAQRGGEIESMAWADIDLENGWWTIPAERAKNGLSHRVPLAPLAIALLKTIRADAEAQAKKKDGQVSPWVFTSPRRGEEREWRHVANVQKAVSRLHDAIKAANDGQDVDFVMHDLRRTAASYMASDGIPRLVISKVLNHVESGVTKVYDRHSYDAEKRQAMEAWADRLGSIIF